MKKIILFIILCLFINIDSSLYASETIFTKNSNISNCIWNPSVNSIYDGSRFIPLLNNLNSPESWKFSCSQSYYTSWAWSSWISKNSNFSCWVWKYAWDIKWNEAKDKYQIFCKDKIALVAPDYVIDWFFPKLETKTISWTKTECSNSSKFFPDLPIEWVDTSSVNQFDCVAIDENINKIKRIDSYKIKAKDNSITSCWYWAKAVWFNNTTKEITCERYISDLNWWYFDAFDNRDIYIYAYDKANPYLTVYSINWWVENKDNKDLLDPRNSNREVIKNKENFSVVSNSTNKTDLTNNNYREYSYNVDKVCDNAWRCFDMSTINNKDLIINIHAADITNKVITQPTWLIADWKEKSFTFKLTDKFSNEILPVKKADNSQIRSVNFELNYDNDLYLNQYLQSWPSWMDGTNFYPWNNKWFFSPFIIWINKKKFSIINDTNSVKTWLYWISFKPYSPTYLAWANDWRQFVDGNFIIKNTTVKLSDKPLSHNLIWYKDMQFKPKHYTNIPNTPKSIIKDGLIVWARQDSNLELKNNFTSSRFSWNILLEYWYIDITSPWDKHKKHNNFILNFNKNWSDSWNSIANWKQTSISNLTNYWNSWWNLYTNLQQKWTLNELEKKTYLATHIKDNVEWKTSIYSSFVYAMDKYTWNYLDDLKNTFQKNIKIIWRLHSFYHSKVVDGEDFSKIWKLTKAELQKEVRKNVFNSIRELKFKSTVSNLNVSNLSFSPNTYWDWIVVWDTLYFWNLSWRNVELSINSFSWVKNIVAFWWNIYIKRNIISNNIKKDFLSIISISDNSWKWWNVYVDPSVTKIEASIYADKSFISYHNSKELSPWNGWTYELLKNQLYIYWSVFSNNTIWWSTTLPFICPYYEVNCNLDNSQKYDLYNIRRWYQNIINTYWTPENVPENLRYSLIIEYNPNITLSTKFFRIE